jgi:hypothetical protein
MLPLSGTAVLEFAICGNLGQDVHCSVQLALSEADAEPGQERDGSPNALSHGPGVKAMILRSLLLHSTDMTFPPAPR